MTFTIDSENNITAHATVEEAAATSTTPFDSFSSQEELAELIAGWPAERLVATFNSLPGVVPVKSFKTSKSAASQIWKRIQGLGEAAKTEAAPAKPKRDKKPKGGAHAAKGAPVKGKAGKKTAAKKNAPAATKPAPKGKQSATAESDGPREGSKMAQVIAMMQRKGGATIEEIMKAMSWQRHTVRGFVAGAMKKAGFTVESFKPAGGSRTYRINK